LIEKMDEILRYLPYRDYLEKILWWMGNR
jgi:hypothetical protein